MIERIKRLVETHSRGRTIDSSIDPPPCSFFDGSFDSVGPSLQLFDRVDPRTGLYVSFHDEEDRSCNVFRLIEFLAIVRWPFFNDGGGRGNITFH